MTTELLTIDGSPVWVIIEQLRFYSPTTNLIETKNAFLCYYKLTEPTPFVLGELFIDKKEIPMIFESIPKALEYAKDELTRRLHH